MHDNQIETRLRSILRAEGDRLPLTITSAELERRIVLRRRRTTGRWVSLVAAAVAVVAVGAIVTFGDGWFQPAIGTRLSPSPSGPVSETPYQSFGSPAVIVGLGRITPAPGGTVQLDLEPTVSDGGARGTFHQELDSTAYVVTVKVACVGDGVVAFAVAGHTKSTNCAPATEGSDRAENPTLFTYPISDALFDGSWTVSDGVAFTFLAETVPLPDRLPALWIPAGKVDVDAASASDRPVPDRPGSTTTRTVGRLPESATQRIVLVCLGPGDLTFSLGPVGQPDLALVVETVCDGQAFEHSNTPLIAGAQDLTISADARIAWHIIASHEGTLPSLAP